MPLPGDDETGPGGSRPDHDAAKQATANLGGLRPETVAIRAGRPEGPGSPLNTPLVPASNYRDGGDRSYARGQPTDTIADLERAIGQLEGGYGVAFASGMAAISAIFDDLPSGARVLAPQDCYQGVAHILDRGQEKHGWKVERIAQTDTDTWLQKIAGRPDLVWIESPSNPLLEVADVPQICQTAADAVVPCAVDNTFATPLLQRPLEHGATWSVHSVTKFIGGHSDLLGGMVVAGSTEDRDRLVHRQVLGGATMGTLEAFLALRGLRTLPVRLARSQSTASEVAQRLNQHQAVVEVRYPGLPTDPSFALATKTMVGPGAIVSFETTGTAVSLDRALTQLRVITPATSLGGVESTIERRAKLQGQEHLPPTLLRLSVGCEHPLDLWTDLETVLDRLPSDSPDSEGH